MSASWDYSRDLEEKRFLKTTHTILPAGGWISCPPRPHMSRGHLREYSCNHRCQDLLQALRTYLHLHRVTRCGGLAAGRVGVAPLRSVRGGGQLDIREVSLLHVALRGCLDLHLLHLAPRHYQYGQIHRRHPPSHLPKHHDRQEVKFYTVYI